MQNEMAESADDRGHDSDDKRLEQTYEQMMNLLPEGYVFQEKMMYMTPSYPIPDSRSKIKPRKCAPTCECDNKQTCRNLKNLLVCPDDCSVCCWSTNHKYSV